MNAARSPGHRRIVTVFGGTGFLGKRIVRHLSNHDIYVRIATRRPEHADARDGAEAVKADIEDAASVAQALDGASGAVNAVSLYVERGGRSFQSIHVDGAARVAEIAAKKRIAPFVHISGIGADPGSSSSYIRARGQGEVAVRQAFPGAVIVRCAAMMGPGDALLTPLARLVKILPLFPLFGDGLTRLQPLHVENAGEAVARILADGAAPAPLLALAGADILTYRELVQTVARHVHAGSHVFPLPFPVWRGLAALGQVLPRPPITPAQVSLMERDNVAPAALPGLVELGVEPLGVQVALGQIEP